MSKLSFKTFCIETYAQHKGLNSTDVFDMFERSKLLELLDTDYEDLHGMGFEYLIHFFDEFLEGNI